MNIQAEKHILFSDICYNFDLSNIVSNDKIEKECYELYSKHPSRYRSNVNGWQSTNITYDYLKEQQLDNTIELIEHFQNILTNIVDQLQAQPLFVDNIWCNINTKNSYNSTHAHPGSILSAAYYVKAEGIESGLFKFKRDRVFSDYSYSSWVNNSTSDWRSEVSVTPKPGTLIIFPSHLLHSVEMNKTTEDRISLSFNTKSI